MVRIAVRTASDGSKIEIEIDNLHNRTWLVNGAPASFAYVRSNDARIVGALNGKLAILKADMDKIATDFTAATAPSAEEFAAIKAKGDAARKFQRTINDGGYGFNPYEAR